MNRPSIAAVALVSAVLGGLFVLANLSVLDPGEQGTSVPYVRLYDDADTRLEVLISQGDGQAFAALAQDPLLRRPDAFRAGAPEAAYRAQRPLLSWLSWALTGGQAGVVPLVLVFLAVLGFGALGVALAWVLELRGAPGGWALVALLTPGTLVTLDWTGPESLGTAFAVAALGAWCDGRQRWAILSLVAAGLLRESLLLVPLALLAHAVLVDRRQWRSVAPLALPFAVFGAWVALVWLRLGALPSDAGRGRLAAPLAGLLDAAVGWGAADLLCAMLIMSAGVLAAVIGRQDPAGWIAGAFVAASLCFGADVWARVEDFSRVLLPVVAFAAVVLLPAWARHRVPVGGARPDRELPAG